MNYSSKNKTLEVYGSILVAWNMEEFQEYLCELITLILLCIFKMFYPRFQWLSSFIPQSFILILGGVAFGVAYSFLSDTNIDHSVWKLTPSFFFNCLLPPIILGASYSLHNRTFTDFFGIVLVYAVLGTVLNFLLIGLLMYAISQIGVIDCGISDLKSFLLFSSLIVAVDPVAVLAIFQDIGVEPGLYYMVFGESLLNDAVTIVLYQIMSQFLVVEVVEAKNIFVGIVSFFTISFGGLFVGVAFGMTTSIVTKWRSHFSAIFLILMSYFAYIVGETLGWSGVIAIIGCGLMQETYTFHNISESANTTVKRIVKQTAELCEGVIFFLIGVQLFSSEMHWDTGFCMCGLFTCLFARIIVVLFLSALMNFIRMNDILISLKEQAILMYGGLRGAVAFSLALLIKQELLREENARKKIITATLFIILITVGLMGLTMKPLVRLFKINLARESKNLSIWADLNEAFLDSALSGIESVIGSNGKHRIREVVTTFNNRYIRRVLQRDPESSAEKLIKTYEKIALKLHFATLYPTQSVSYLRNVPELLVRQHLANSDVLLGANSELNLNEALSRSCTSLKSMQELSPIYYPTQEKEKKEFKDVYLGLMNRKSRYINQYALNNLSPHANDNRESGTDLTRDAYTETNDDDEKAIIRLGDWKI